ncbi:hypothetical protein D3C73_1304540 [compost metagenome]
MNFIAAPVQFRAFAGAGVCSWPSACDTMQIDQSDHTYEAYAFGASFTRSTFYGAYAS